MGTWQDPQVWAWSAPALLEDLSGREGNHTYFEILRHVNCLLWSFITPFTF